MNASSSLHRLDWPRRVYDFKDVAISTYLLIAYRHIVVFGEDKINNKLMNTTTCS